jgi:hypothetical protein
LLVWILVNLNAVMRKISGFTHFAQFAVQWGISPYPEWFDHYLDQHWQWSAKNNSLWVERGVFSRLVLKPNAKMLENLLRGWLQCTPFLFLAGILDTRTRF